MTENQQPDDPPPNLQRLVEIESYLAHELTPDECVQFEARMTQDSSLQAEVDFERSLRSVLVRKFASPTPSGEFLERLRQTASGNLEQGPVVVPPPVVGGAWRLSWVQLALALSLMVASALFTYQNWPVEPNRYRFNDLSLVEIYDKSLQQGFTPTWKCDVEQEFAKTFLTRQGQALVMRNTPPTIVMAGLAYFGGMSPKTTALLCRVEGVPVIVFVDLQSQERQQRESVPGGLQIHRTELGQLVLLEVSPFPQARVSKFLVPIAPEKIVDFSSAEPPNSP